ncbi:DUF599 family protein [Corticibacterium sp. UT-5YL-CI-8]|nr:DUF599 family protein [Tianweitania sp. UT-5YL-CI-8]
MSVGTMPLSLGDYVALVLFLIAWQCHSLAVESVLFKRRSLTQAMNLQRGIWLETMARREVRIVDTSIMSGLQQGTAFFASSSLIALGGCFALLGASDNVLGLLTDLAITEAPSRRLFEIKVIGLILILAYSFFKFGWAYRLFNYCTILLGAVPIVHRAGPLDAATIAAVSRVMRMNVLAGKHFNAGLRGVFFSIGYLGWFIGPQFLLLTTALLLFVLVRRQFFSAARLAVIDQPSEGPGNGSSIRPDSQ